MYNKLYAFPSTEQVEFDVLFVNKWFCYKNQCCFFEQWPLGAIKKLISLKLIIERVTTDDSSCQIGLKVQGTVIMSQFI